MLQNERERVEYIPWVRIVPDPAQPREDIPPDHVERVAASIKARGGLLQYPRVRLDAALGKYVIITGHCRWLACEQAKLDPVPCIVVTGDVSFEAILQDQITENELRQGLKPLELARALAKLKALKGATSQALAAEVGLSGATITRSESLLSLPEDIQAMVDDGRVPAAAAYELSRLPDEGSQRSLAQAVAAKQMSRDQVAEAVRSRIGKRKTTPKGGRISYRLDGVCVTVTADQPLTRGHLQAAIDRMRQEAKKLPDTPLEAAS